MKFNTYALLALLCIPMATNPMGARLKQDIPTLQSHIHFLEKSETAITAQINTITPSTRGQEFIKFHTDHLHTHPSPTSRIAKLTERIAKLKEQETQQQK